MKRGRMMHPQIAGFLFLTLASSLSAQELNTSPAGTWSTPKQNTASGTPSTLSDQAFQAKVTVQATDTRKQLEQDTANLIAQMDKDQKKKASLPDASLDTTDTTQQPAATDQTAASNDDTTQATAAPSNFTTPPPLITQPPPVNPPQNNQQPAGGNNKGNWQIQY